MSNTLETDRRRPPILPIAQLEQVRPAVHQRERTIVSDREKREYARQLEGQENEIKKKVSSLLFVGRKGEDVGHVISLGDSRRRSQEEAAHDKRR